MSLRSVGSSPENLQCIISVLGLSIIILPKSGPLLQLAVLRISAKDTPFAIADVDAPCTE